MPPEGRVSVAELEAAGLTDWRRLAQGISARWVVASLAQGAAFVAEVAVAVTHTPGVRMADSWVQLESVTVDDGWWLTGADLEAAAVISAVAARLGLRAVPAQVTQVELGLDSADGARLGPFWAAVLLGDAGALSHGEVIDGDRQLPNVWWQEAPGATAGVSTQRFHPDVWVAPEAAAGRIAAAVAAGGTVVDESEAPSCTVVADADGNRACICTSAGR